MDGDTTRILVVEDDEHALLAGMLAGAGYAVTSAQGSSGARKLFDAGERIDAAVIELGRRGDTLGDASVVAQITRMAPGVPLVVVSPEDNRDVAVDCIRAGAHDVLGRQNLEPGRLQRAVSLALARSEQWSHERDQAAELRQQNRRLRELSTIDALTELFNPRGLEQVVIRERARLRRLGGSLCAVLLRLDGAESLDHGERDALLARAARRLAASVRASDHVGYVGGGEYLVVLPDTRIAEAKVVAGRARQAIREVLPGAGVGHDSTVTVASGVSTIGRDASLEGALALTREALEERRRESKPSPSGDEDELDELLRSVIEGDALDVVAQPIVRLPSERHVGWELFVRGPTGPFRLPADLFRLAAERRVHTRLDSRCLEVCLDAAARQGLEGTLHVNLLPSTLLAMDDEALAGLAARAGHGGLVVELSERHFVGHSDALMARVETLTGLGVRLAIDDAGSGRGNLDSAVLLEPSFVKVDGDIVGGIATSSDKRRLCQRLVRLADALHISLIAEGVDSAEDLRVVKELGFPLAQGFHWTAPFSVAHAR